MQVRRQRIAHGPARIAFDSRFPGSRRFVGNSVPGTGGFSAGPGYDQITGLGSPDAFQLLQHWNSASVRSLYASVSSPNISVAEGASASTTITVSPSKGFSASVTFAVTGLLPT
jgi:hypothetical protein